MFRVRLNVSLTVDDKGRIVLPANVRSDLARHEACEPRGRKGLVLTIKDGTLWLWTTSHFEDSVEANVSAYDAFAPEARAFANAFLCTAEDVSADKAGRMVIPPRHRAVLGIDVGVRDFVIYQVLGHIEIVRADEYNERWLRAQEEHARLGMPRPRA